jgi:phospholipase/carboxylesterase
VTSTELLGGLTTHLVGDEDATRAVVLLHGFGAPGADLVPLADVLPRAGVLYAFPEAPLVLPWGWDSRAWWMIDVERLERGLAAGRPIEMPDAVPPGMLEARAAIASLLGDLRARRGIPLSRCVVGGFSQGSMLALDVALHADESPAGLVLWSTALPARSASAALFVRRSGLRALMSHGTDDPLLSFEASSALKDALVAAGWNVDWRPFRGVHEIPKDALAGAAALIASMD